MNKKLTVSVVTALCALIGSAEAAGFSGSSPTDVYLLLGQSNMAGRGVLTADNRLDTTRVVKWNCWTQGGDGNAWIEAVEPIVQDRDFSGAGLAASFARALADDNPSAVIGLVPAAEGDTKLERWMPGGDLYARAVRWTQAALAKGGVLKGILWHQGCGDAGREETATTYAARLKAIVASLRADLAAPRVPFVAGELGQYLDELQTEGRPTLGYWRIINAQLAEAAGMIPRMRLVRSNGLTHKGDRLHFDTSSVRTLGLRYAAAIRDLAQEELEVHSAIFDARTFGAKGDGTTKDTSAVQAAIDAASAAGGGEVRLSAGTYVSGSIFLKSNVDFHLEAGAVLLGSPDKDDYNAADICPQNYAYRPESSSGAHLILCIEQKNVTVRGPGRIDGNSAGFLFDPTTGHEWGYVPGSQSAGQGSIPWRPSQMLYFVESQGIRVQDLELANSTYWTLFLHGCERVKIRGLDIHNERDRFHTCNGDGIDIDCCQRVSISDCSIRTADDCITLRADGARLKTNRDCAYVTVGNCTLSSKCNCVRLGVGSGRVHDAVFSNIVVHDARTAVNFVSSWDPSAAKGVDFWNVRFVNWAVDCKQLLHFSVGDVAAGVVRQAELRDVSFSGFTGRAPLTSGLFGSPSAPVRNVLFRDVDVPTVLRVKCAENVRIEGGALVRSDVRDTKHAGNSGCCPQ